MAEHNLPAIIESIHFETNGAKPIVFTAHLSIRVVAAVPELQALQQHVDREGARPISLLVDDLHAYLPPPVAQDTLTSALDQVIERQRGASIVDHQHAIVSQGVLYDLLALRARSQQLGEQQARRSARKASGGNHQP